MNSKEAKEAKKQRNQELARTEDPMRRFTPRKVGVAKRGGPSKLSILNHGYKGVGKTFKSLVTPGSKAVLSYDRVSEDTAEAYEDMGLAELCGPVQVVNDHMDAYDPEESVWRESCTQCLVDTINVLEEILKGRHHEIKKKPDVLIHDGSQFIGEISEGAMRLRFGLGKYENFEQRGYWKYRREKLLKILNLSKKIAQRAVIFTAYVDKDINMPKYTGIVEEKMLVVNRIDAGLLFNQEKIPTGITRNISVLSSKRPQFLMTGANFDTSTPEGLSRYINAYTKYWELDEINWRGA